MSQRIALYCSDRGGHARIHFDAFDVDGEHVEHVRFRRGRSVSGEGTAVEDGREVAVSIPARGLVPVESAQDARGTWRWRCPECGQDFRTTDLNLRRILVALASNPVVSRDLSLILR